MLRKTSFSISSRLFYEVRKADGAAIGYPIWNVAFGKSGPLCSHHPQSSNATYIASLPSPDSISTVTITQSEKLQCLQISRILVL